MTIVVGYVPRRQGLAAVEAAITEAIRTGERLVVVNAGRDGDPRGTGLADRRDIDDLCRRLADHGVPHDVWQPVRGLSPADELLATVDSCAARLLVVGLRYGHPLGVEGDGSTVQQVLLHAACDVLVVRFRGA